MKGQGVYSLKNILKQNPLAVKSAAMAILGALVVTGVITLSSEAIAAWAVAIEMVLNLFYVSPSTVNRAKLEQLNP